MAIDMDAPPTSTFPSRTPDTGDSFVGVGADAEVSVEEKVKEEKDDKSPEEILRSHGMNPNLSPGKIPEVSGESQSPDLSYGSKSEPSLEGKTDIISPKIEKRKMNLLYPTGNFRRPYPTNFSESPQFGPKVPVNVETQVKEDRPVNPMPQPFSQQFMMDSKKPSGKSVPLTVNDIIQGNAPGGTTDEPEIMGGKQNLSISEQYSQLEGTNFSGVSGDTLPERMPEDISPGPPISQDELKDLNLDMPSDEGKQTGIPTEELPSPEEFSQMSDEEQKEVLNKLDTSQKGLNVDKLNEQLAIDTEGGPTTLEHMRPTRKQRLEMERRRQKRQDSGNIFTAMDDALDWSAKQTLPHLSFIPGTVSSEQIKRNIERAPYGPLPSASQLLEFANEKQDEGVAGKIGSGFAYASVGITGTAEQAVELLPGEQIIESGHTKEELRELERTVSDLDQKVSELKEEDPLMEEKVETVTEHQKQLQEINKKSKNVRRYMDKLKNEFSTEKPSDTDKHWKIKLGGETYYSTKNPKEMESWQKLKQEQKDLERTLDETDARQAFQYAQEEDVRKFMKAKNKWAKKKKKAKDIKRTPSMVNIWMEEGKNTPTWGKALTTAGGTLASYLGSKGAGTAFGSLTSSFGPALSNLPKVGSTAAKIGSWAAQNPKKTAVIASIPELATEGYQTYQMYERGDPWQAIGANILQAGAIEAGFTHGFETGMKHPLPMRWRNVTIDGEDVYKGLVWEGTEDVTKQLDTNLSDDVWIGGRGGAKPVPDEITFTRKGSRPLLGKTQTGWKLGRPSIEEGSDIVKTLSGEGTRGWLPSNPTEAMFARKTGRVIWPDEYSDLPELQAGMRHYLEGGYNPTKTVDLDELPTKRPFHHKTSLENPDEVHDAVLKTLKEHTDGDIELYGSMPERTQMWQATKKYLDDTVGMSSDDVEDVMDSVSKRDFQSANTKLQKYGADVSAEDLEEMTGLKDWPIRDFDLDVENPQQLQDELYEAIKKAEGYKGADDIPHIKKKGQGIVVEEPESGRFRHLFDIHKAGESAYGGGDRFLAWGVGRGGEADITGDVFTKTRGMWEQGSRRTLHGPMKWTPEGPAPSKIGRVKDIMRGGAVQRAETTLYEFDEGLGFGGAPEARMAISDIEGMWEKRLSTLGSEYEDLYTELSKQASVGGYSDELLDMGTDFGKALDTTDEITQGTTKYLDEGVGMSRTQAEDIMDDVSKGNLKSANKKLSQFDTKLTAEDLKQLTTGTKSGIAIKSSDDLITPGMSASMATGSFYRGPSVLASSVPGTSSGSLLGASISASVGLGGGSSMAPGSILDDYPGGYGGGYSAEAYESGYPGVYRGGYDFDGYTPKPSSISPRIRRYGYSLLYGPPSPSPGEYSPSPPSPGMYEFSIYPPSPSPSGGVIPPDEEKSKKKEETKRREKKEYRERYFDVRNIMRGLSGSQRTRKTSQQLYQESRRFEFPRVQDILNHSKKVVQRRKSGNKASQSKKKSKRTKSITEEVSKIGNMRVPSVNDILGG